MSKLRRKQGKEDEYYKGQIRKLESENRQLRKRLKQLDKREHLYEDLIEAVAEEIKPPKNGKCPECRDGTLSHHDLKYVRIEKCDECKYRKKI